MSRLTGGLIAVAALLAGAALALLLAGTRERTVTETRTVVARQAMEAVGPAVAHVRVRETEYRLNPANPVVRPAGVIDFFVQNQGTVTHALAVETPHGTVRSENLSPDATTRLKVDLPPGRYTWYCPIDGHKAKGMSGTIRVVQPVPKPTTTPQAVTQRTVIRTTTVRQPPTTVTKTVTRTVTTP
jgi:plastocyanin